MSSQWFFLCEFNQRACWEFNWSSSRNVKSPSCQSPARCCKHSTKLLITLSLDPWRPVMKINNYNRFVQSVHGVISLMTHLDYRDILDMFEVSLPLCIQSLWQDRSLFWCINKSQWAWREFVGEDRTVRRKGGAVRRCVWGYYYPRKWGRSLLWLCKELFSCDKRTCELKCLISLINISWVMRLNPVWWGLCRKESVFGQRQPADGV